MSGIQLYSTMPSSEGSLRDAIYHLSSTSQAYFTHGLSLPALKQMGCGSSLVLLAVGSKDPEEAEMNNGALHRAT